MMDFLLRVEALNFDPTIFDTNDLSTIRGMGLVMLKSPVRDLAGFRKIYSGASVALWRFQAENKEDAALKVEAYREALREPFITPEEEAENLGPRVTTVHRQITFALQWVTCEGSFNAQHRASAAGCRWRQMEEPALVYPEEALADAEADKVCEVDGVRPAGVEENRPEGRTRWVSPFTFARRQLGLADRHLRERFYVGYVGAEHAPTSYCNDLDQVTDYCGFGGRLNHKMAVIHLDGNGFGKRAMGCESDRELTDWSNRLAEGQNGFLRRLVEVTDDADAWAIHKEGETEFRRSPWRWAGIHTDNRGRQRPKHDAWRMEILLWGGDEIAIVVPAWAGWWTLAKFFGMAAGAAGPNKLSYGAGLVFCHHNAPIRRVRHLADKLARRAKQVSRTENRCAYQVLESFDDLGLNPDATTDKLLQLARLTHADLVVEGAEMEPMLQIAAGIREAIPKSKAYDIVRLLLGGEEDQTHRLVERTLEKAQGDFGDSAEQGIRVFNLRPLTDGQLDKRCKAGWLHLVELWDYLPPRKWSDPFDGGTPPNA